MTEDATLGGYLRKHERAPAFSGSDGAPYTVSVLVDADVDGRFGAALLFVRWSDTGDRPVGHLESDYLTFGATEKDAKAGIHDLSLHEVKAELERLITRAAAGPPGAI